jgi:hypothetical protein
MKWGKCRGACAWCESRFAYGVFSSGMGHSALKTLPCVCVAHYVTAIQAKQWSPRGNMRLVEKHSSMAKATACPLLPSSNVVNEWPTQPIFQGCD